MEQNGLSFVFPSACNGPVAPGPALPPGPSRQSAVCPPLNATFGPPGCPLKANGSPFGVKHQDANAKP